MNDVLQYAYNNPNAVISLAGALYELIARKAPTKKTLSIITLVGRFIRFVFPDKKANGCCHV